MKPVDTIYLFVAFGMASHILWVTALCLAFKGYWIAAPSFMFITIIIISWWATVVYTCRNIGREIKKMLVG